MTVVTEEPTGVAQVLTPSGIEIYYQSGPKRLYRINAGLGWREVPSVSTVLDVLEKGGLSWWGMKVGIEGSQTLVRNAIDVHRRAALDVLDEFTGMPVDYVVDSLKEHKLTVNHVKGAAADRGTNVHTALESFAETGITPDPRFYPENERGYVQGLVNFINDAHPHPLQSEVMVASLDGYAGRFDLLANLDFAGKVVTKTYPKRADVREQISGAWLLDLKTSKDVYPSYHIQLVAYYHGLKECGYDLPDHMGVVRVTDDGRYELVESTATYDDFLNVLQTYNSVQRIKGK